MRRTSPLIPLGFLLFASLINVARAASFPDVQSNHPYRTAILALADRGVINGYNNGNFGPNDPVTRAQMLTLLYRLSERMPAIVIGNCFPDVKSDQWYTGVVCDAAAEGFVQGYPDGTFQPNKTVSRGEALKMLFTVLDLQAEPGGMMYSDVPEGEWYYQFVTAALSQGILPIPGQTDRYQAGVVMLRGEVAQLLYQAAGMGPAPEVPIDVLVDEPVEEDTTTEAPQAATTTATSTTTKHEGYSAATETVAVTPPFSKLRIFEQRETVVYRFDVTSEQTLRLVMNSSADRTPECRLYKIEQEGLAFEYYIGAQSGEECWMRVALSPGTYQFEVTADPGEGRVTMESAKDDGSDGFRQAKGLARAVNVSSDLPEDDYADWYTFVVTRQTQMTIGVTNVGSSSTLQCAVYPLKDVNLSSFAWPTCNEPFIFEQGTYVLGVMHSSSALRPGQRRKETMTVRLQ
jgi:S-layer homology domain